MSFTPKLPFHVAGLQSDSEGELHWLSRHDANTVTVSDAYLLFSGDYKRSASDLILSKDGREQVIENYFRGEKRATLSSPDGAQLSGEIVDALTGHVQYAQAGGVTTDIGKLIGHVTKLTGSATAVRNGVSWFMTQPGHRTPRCSVLFRSRVGEKFRSRVGEKIMQVYVFDSIA